MYLTNDKASVLDSDPYKVQAAELLVVILQHQQLDKLSGSSGADAAGFCSDFIDTFANRLRAMSTSKP